MDLMDLFNKRFPNSKTTKEKIENHLRKTKIYIHSKRSQHSEYDLAELARTFELKRSKVI
jgi:hypothetical protein